ncbi:hypothetical protein AC1031_018344 [Aphanomyces cochlioides]|nr:hypothetical protein AC1031_018344 [Aphanomyces cochlioides]
MSRHLRSLHNMERDHGWIHTLLEEAENERMHSLIFTRLKNPSLFFRLLEYGGHGLFFTAFSMAYLVPPKTCHRFVGCVEEEAVAMYTALVHDIEDGHVGEWKTQVAPAIAREYYHLEDDASTLDMIKCIRADETDHRDVNHTFANLDWCHDINPFVLNNRNLK